MKTKKYFGVILILALLISLIPAGIASAATTKVSVCHLDEFGVYHLITISEMAFPAHVDHGDASPNEWVPGHPGYKFNDDCSLRLDLTGHWHGTSGLLTAYKVYGFYMDLVQVGTNVTGTIQYEVNSTATRTVTGSLVGSTLTITTADASYSATVSGTATGTYFFGTGTGTPVAQLVALEAFKQ